MFGIEAIASYVPAARLSNVDKLQDFGISTDFLDDKIGARFLPIKGQDEDTSDMAIKAIDELFQKVELNKADIDGLVVCTQNPDGYGLPHTSAVIHGKLGLNPECAAFDVSLGCSGYVYGCSIVQAFALANNLKNILLVTCDPYSKIVSDNDKNTRLLFGDAATVTLFSEGRERLFMCEALFATEGKNGAALRVKEDGKLEMNGRAVFNFSATVVPQQIKALLRKAKIDIEDIDYFLLHQGSRYILDTLAKRLELPHNKVLTTLGQTGNTVSSSIPLLLEQLLQEPKRADRILLSGFGVGLSYATAIMERKIDD